MGFFKKIINSIIGRDDARFRMQNSAFDLSLQMHNRINDGLIKLLLVHRFKYSNDINDKKIVEEFRKTIFPDIKILDDEDITNLVEIIFESMPVMQRLRFPEATIATISETYHNIKRNSDISDKQLIFRELDRTRNANHLSNFGNQDLNLKNYIIHVMKYEDENNLMDRINIDFLKEQIQIADDFGTDHNARANMAMGRDF